MFFEKYMVIFRAKRHTQKLIVSVIDHKCLLTDGTRAHFIWNPLAKSKTLKNSDIPNLSSISVI